MIRGYALPRSASESTLKVSAVPPHFAGTTKGHCLETHNSHAYGPEVPPRVEYEISELGRSLAPLFAHLAEGTAENLDKVERARHDYDAGSA